MMILRRYSILMLLLVLAGACRQKKKPSLSGNDPVAVTDFIDFFQPVQLPFQYADTSLLKKSGISDSLLISTTVFKQFVPDSVLHPFFTKSAKPRIYPLGKYVVSKGETYLFVRAEAGEKRGVFLLIFNRKPQYANYMKLLVPDQDKATSQSFVMDRRGTITKAVTRKNPDGSSNEGKDVYAYSNEGNSFNLIMTDALEDKPTELINPIDTLSRKFRYAGDYVNGKMNLISIRDGRKADRISFFIHFEKSAECTGELKGEALLRTATTAEYNQAGDPCKLKFTFSSTAVTVKELGGCGSYRPLNCSFDQRLSKKKEPKPKKKSRRK